MASFGEVTKTLLKNVPLNKCVAPNNHVGKKILQNLIKVLLLITACWKDFFSKINKRAALLFGTLEHICKMHQVERTKNTTKFGPFLKTFLLNERFPKKGYYCPSGQ